MNVEIPLGEVCSKENGDPFDISLPDLDAMLTLNLSFANQETHVGSAQLVVSDTTLQRVLDSFRLQLMSHDLRCLHPKFSGFTEPIKATFDLSFQWPEADQPILDIGTIRA